MTPRQFIPALLGNMSLVSVETKSVTGLSEVLLFQALSGYDFEQRVNVHTQNLARSEREIRQVTGIKTYCFLGPA